MTALADQIVPLPLVAAIRRTPKAQRRFLVLVVDAELGSRLQTRGECVAELRGADLGELAARVERAPPRPLVVYIGGDAPRVEAITDAR